MTTTRILALTLALLPAVAGARDLGRGTFELSGDTSTGFTRTTLRLDGAAGETEETTISLGGGTLFYPVTNFGVGVATSYTRMRAEDDVDTVDVSWMSAAPRPS